MNNKYLLAAICTLLIFTTANAQTTDIAEADTVNYATTLNDPDAADCFPFITADGLTIYFASGRNGGHASIFYSKRINTESYFESAVLLGNQFDKEFDSPSLTADELTIYVMNKTDDKLLKATRKNKAEPFGALTVVKIVKKEKIYAPCISPNGKQLVITDYDNEVLEFYELSVKNVFELKYIHTEIKEGDVIKIGRFGDDGLSLYATKVSEGEDATEEKIVVLKRKQLADKFTACKELLDKKGDAIINSHATVCKNGSLLACTNNIGDSWNDNNIKIINLKK
jgi:hypothetical protein